MRSTTGFRPYHIERIEVIEGSGHLADMLGLKKSSNGEAVPEGPGMAPPSSPPER